MSSESSWGNNHHFVHIGKTKYKWNFGKNIDDAFFFFLVNCAKFEPDWGKFIISIKFVQSGSNFAQFTNIKKQVHYYPSLSQDSGFESYELSIFIEKTLF